MPREYWYLLVIARKQPKDWLLAKAKLVFQPEGLPGFEVLETETVGSEKEARQRLSEWKESAG